jgi:hypothetical protein
VLREDRAFFLRFAKVGEWFYEGADLGILVTPGRLMTRGFKLTERAKGWIAGIRSHYESGRASASKMAQATKVAEASGFKLL